MTLTKLTAAIEMLKMLVFLSIHGFRYDAAARMASSMTSRAMAVVICDGWARAMNMDFTRTEARTGTTNQ